MPGARVAGALILAVGQALSHLPGRTQSSRRSCACSRDFGDPTTGHLLHNAPNTATIREQSQAKDRHAPTFPASCMCVDDSRGRDAGRATRGCRAAGSLEGSNCDRPRWRGVLGGPVRDRDRPEGAGPRRQRRRCRRRHGGCPGRHGALQRGNRRWWILRLLRRPLSTGPHHRRAGNRAESHASRLLRQPRDRFAASLCRGGDQRAVRRRTRHARHLGVGPGSLGVDRPQAGAATGGSARPPRIRCRRDLPAADGGQRRTLRRLHQLPGTCSFPAVRPPRSAQFCAIRI